MIRTIGRATFVAALLSTVATAAMAQVTGSAPGYNCNTVTKGAGTTCVNGGGSSLASFVYGAAATTTPAFSGGMLTQYAASTGGTTGFTYENASSGAGQAALLSGTPDKFGNGDLSTAFTVHFGASDAFVTGTTAGTLGAYVGAGKPMPTGGQFIQIPMFATPITIPVANAKMITNGSVTLNDNDLCGIFSGKLTNWNQTSVASKLTAGTIKVYWRADNLGSGTTFLLTQHLAKVCTTNNTLSGFTFSANSRFARLFNGVHGVTITEPPADNTTAYTIPVAADGSFGNFVAIKGSGGMANGVNNDTSAIGYVSPDFTSIAVQQATTTQTKKFNKLFVASLLNASNNTAYLPTVVNVSLALANPGSAVNAAPPALTAAAASVQTNWIPQIALPAKGYPIVGYTNWLLASCYKSATVANSLIGVLTQLYGGTYNTLLQNNGFVPVNGSTNGGYGSAITKAFLTNQSGLGLNINNATTCKGKVAR